MHVWHLPAKYTFSREAVLMMSYSCWIMNYLLSWIYIHKSRIWFTLSHDASVLCLTVHTQLHHAGKNAQPDVNVQRQPVFTTAHRQLHHAIVCKANIHGNALHERGNLHQVSLDHQWNVKDQDTLRYICQCKHQRHWQGTSFYFFTSIPSKIIASHYNITSWWVCKKMLDVVSSFLPVICSC